jgi:cell division protein FtsZ
MKKSAGTPVRIKVVGVGGAGGNAVLRMASSKLQGLEFLAINTDVQALSSIKQVPTFAIGPTTTGGMGSGGNADMGRKAMRESQNQVSQLLEGSDMVFITAGMGGGTGTGATMIIAEIARKQGALTVAVVTRPFSFEGAHRREVSDRGLQQLSQKVDTLITVDNDRLLPSLDSKLSLEKAFRLADEVLRQGVLGISEIIAVPGLINVDFADVKAIMTNGGRSFMAIGEGRGRSAATDAAQAAISNPLFDAPLEGASGILLNIKGGKDLTLGQVHEVAGIISEASHSQAQVIFGVVRDTKLHKRVHIALVATGLASKEKTEVEATPALGNGALSHHRLPAAAARPPSNGYQAQAGLGALRLL